MALTVDMIENACDEAGIELLNHKTQLAPAQALFEALLPKLQDSGSAGTHAYELLADVARSDSDSTMALVGLVAAAVMMKGYEKRMNFGFAPVHREVSIEPRDLDDVYKKFDIEESLDGMVHRIKITLKPIPDEVGLMVQDEDVSGALPQAEHADEPERPHWFARIRGELQPADNASAAMLMVETTGDRTAQIENRNCSRTDCPNSALQKSCIHCEPSEVTSELTSEK